MVVTKGALLEEVVRAYFAKQGFFALRSVPLRYERDDVTDVDIWLYTRQSASVRTRAVVDVKNKKSPRALERVLWTKGLQAITGADRAIVVTTDANPHIVKFGHEHKVVVLTKAFLDRLQKTLSLEERLSLEEFLESVRQYSAHKTDGDWIRTVEEVKSGLISLPPYPAFNRSMNAFGYFVPRIEARPHYAVQALRCAFLCAAIGCIALDAALERVVFEDIPNRSRAILEGVTYGDTGDGKVRRSIDNVLNLIEESMENGRAIARQAQAHIESSFGSVRADILAEHFSREHNSSQLVSIARELEAAAHRRSNPDPSLLSTEARSLLGVLADFVKVRRQLIIGRTAVGIAEAGAQPHDATSEALAASPQEVEQTDIIGKEDGKLL